jgi:flagellin-specific chaperone FliS
MKRTTILAAALLVAGTVVVEARERVDRTRTAAELRESPCLMVLAGIERHQQAIEEAGSRLARLARLAGEADREKITAYKEKLAARAAQFRATYGDLARRFRVMSDEEIAAACRTHRAELAAARDRIVEELAKLRRFEADIRGRVATSRRLALALRATDDMLLKATRISRGTDNVDDAFPGLRRAYELQENAKQALAAGRLEASMQMTLRARDILGQTLREALDEQDARQVRRHVKASYQRTVDAVERLSERVDATDNPKAARLVEVAGNELAKARELIDERPYVAVKHVERARRIVREMRRFAVRGNRCEERVTRLEERLDRASEIVEESDDEKALEVLTKAKEHYRRGVELCEAAQTTKATVQLDIAAKLTARAVELAGDVTRADKAIAREIRKTALIVKKAAEVAATDEAERRVARAKELVAEARERIDQPRVSLKLLDQATDIAFAVIARSRGADTDAATESLE